MQTLPKIRERFSLVSHVGGGSTMGYKLAGFDVIGCNEIDPRMNEVYIKNHNPKYNFCCDIREMVDLAKRKALPEELYNLDILDGSPPCSSFSICGNREEDWGKEKHFREGQKKQVLDTLFFDFIALAKELRPKVVVAENVKGILIADAIKYVRKIYDDLSDAGYYCSHFLLNASKMGVPQNRERVFFVCLRKDLAGQFLYDSSLFEQTPYIDMSFNENTIPMKDFVDYKGKTLGGEYLKLWKEHCEGESSLADACFRVKGKASFFCETIAYENKACPTLTAQNKVLHHGHPCRLSVNEVLCVSSFPQDYNFCGQNFGYVCGMSVPPVMMAQIASRIYEQWLSKIN